MIAGTTYTDHDIQSAVQDELAWTADVDPDGIGVAVEEGTVALSGEVNSYAELLAVTRAALRVRGVRAIVDDLTIHNNIIDVASETDIAKEVQRALNANVSVPDTIKAKVSKHHVTLIGETKWDFERTAAMRAVEHLHGVAWVSSEVSLTPRPTADDAPRRIKEAFVRHAQLDANNVDAFVVGNTVTLTGTVHSWAEKDQAGQAAWSSPHVMHVNNDIVVNSE